MKAIKPFLFLLFACYSMCSMAQALSSKAIDNQKRLALVIGNAKYQFGNELINPTNDARTIKNALLKVGFDVYEYENLNQSQMKKAIDEFGNRLKDYHVGLFYYAGHGIQSKGFNYLIPIDANLQAEEQVEYDCVQADRVLALMESAGNKVNIIVLDACRNNPFGRSWKRSMAGNQGLAFMNAPSGTLIAYATSPGNTASDGTGKNGLYTSALLENIAVPNITILQMFQNVRRIVAEKSNKQQIPWESTSLIGDFYFTSNESNAQLADKRPPKKQETSLGKSSETSDYALNINKQDENKKVSSRSEMDNRNSVSGNNYNGLFSGSMTDERDGSSYKTITIGNLVWMAENLNFSIEKDSYCYKNDENNCKSHGRLYLYKIANNVCPQGWRLPTKDELDLLVSNLKRANSTISDFVNPFGGLYMSVFGQFSNIDRSAWLAANKGGSMRIDKKDADARTNFVDIYDSWAVSVRCIKNE